MTVLTLMMSLLVLQGTSFRVGFTFGGSWPSMSDEKDYADLLTQGGLDFKLDDITWTGGVEALGDVSEKLRLRGAVTVSRFHGTYEDNYDPFGYALAGILTGGLLFLFGSGNDEIVALADRSTNIELACYYKLTGNPAVSIGAGPCFAMVSRSIDTPNTASSESATGMGFSTGLRIDQESGGGFLGLPLVFGVEGGYRYNSVKFDGQYMDDFSVDFTGLYLKVGSYLKF